MVSFLLLLLYLNDDLRTAFQDGCKKIVDKLTALGYEPEDPQGPDEINISIQNIYDKRYTEGYKDGVDKTTANAKIEYIYHKHTKGDGTESLGTIYSTTNPGGCYRAAGHTHNATGTCTSTYHPAIECGLPFSDNGNCPVHHSSDSGDHCTYHVQEAYTSWNCGSPTNTWVIGCGKNSSSIDKAIVTF